MLGPLEIVADGRPPARMGGRQQRLLAVLLLEANRVIPVTRLVEALWDGRPPPTANRQVQNAISALRGCLAATGVVDPAQVLATHSAGYALRVAAPELDRLTFEERVRAAERLSARGDLRGAADELRSALGLWRGPALAGLHGRVIAAGADRLNEAWLAARERWLDLELALGCHRDVVGELAALVAEHPLREGLVDRLMLALYRSGRRTEALAAYRDFRSRLADELGLDPSPELSRRHEAILRNDQGADLPQPEAQPGGMVVTVPAATREWSPPTRPRQLPPDVPDFVGRTDLLAELRHLAAGSGEGCGVPIAVLAGTAGVGKSALAVHWAHQATDVFCDGHLYVDLGGHAARPPTSPGQALAALLHGLGVPGDGLPTDLAERAGLLRSLLADRRMLLLLDNAGSAEQVRPLLPGSPGCLVLVTSRGDLLGLVASHGARLFQVDVLSPAEATELLVRVVGPQRTGSAQPATAELARLCAYLPLALRIVAANLLGHPHWTPADLVARLASGRRLDQLVVPGDRQSAVRTAFDLSYQELRPSARVLFRRLGLLPCGDLDSALAARLLELPDAAAELDQLVSAHLVEQHAVGRYRCHDLLRLFAAECADQEGPAGRAACQRRTTQHYLDRVRAVTQALGAALPEEPATICEQPFADAAQARAWLDVELANLVAVVEDAAVGGQPDAWQLATALRGHLAAGGHTEEWVATARAGLLAAQLADDLPAQAAMRKNLGTAHWSSARHDAAIDQLVEGLELYRRLGDPAGEAAVLGNLANVFWQVARFTEAVDHGRRALALFARLGDRFGEATVRAVLANTYLDLGQLDDALDHGRQALTAYRASGSPTGEASVLNNLAGAHRERGELARAAELAADALRISRRTGFRAIEAGSLDTLATIDHLANRNDAALEHVQQALALAREIHNARIEAAALSTLGHVHMGLGRPADALDAFHAALSLAGRARYRRVTVEALLGLAEAARRNGQPVEAAQAARQAVQQAADVGLRRLLDRARALVAASHRDG